jgi:hypothetical protein
MTKLQKYKVSEVPDDWTPEESKIIQQVREIAAHDTKALNEAEKSYGDSWKKRGGVGAFMMLARKWDRIENTLEKLSFPMTFDIFEGIRKDQREEGIIDDIKDLRRYLLLVEAQMRVEGGEEDEQPDFFRKNGCEWKTG